MMPPPARIEALITAATQRMELATGTFFVQRDYTEYHRVTLPVRRVPQLDPEWVPLPSSLILQHHPIVEIIEDGVRITPQVTDPNGLVLLSSEFTVDTAQGILYHVGTWPRLAGVWTIALRGGWWPTTGHVGHDVKQAAALLVQEQMASGGGATTGGSVLQPIASERVGPVSVTYAKPSTATSGVPRIPGLPPLVGDYLEPYLTIKV